MSVKIRNRHPSEIKLVIITNLLNQFVVLRNLYSVIDSCFQQHVSLLFSVHHTYTVKYEWTFFPQLFHTIH